MSRSAKEILQERARALAAPMAQAPTDPVGLTLFRRGGQLLGIRLAEVAAGGLLRQLSPIPGGPAWLLGALHHRGQVISLLDLPTLWGLPTAGVRDLPSFVVLTDGVRRLGLAVEELLGVHEVVGGLIPYAGETRAGLQEVARYQERSVLVLSAPRLFADPRLGL